MEKFIQKQIFQSAAVCTITVVGQTVSFQKRSRFFPTTRMRRASKPVSTEEALEDKPALAVDTCIPELTAKERWFKPPDRIIRFAPWNVTSMETKTLYAMVRSVVVALLNVVGSRVK
jgi:hypothetical protein